MTVVLPADGGRLAVERGVGPASGRLDAGVGWLLVEGGRGRLTLDGEGVDIADREDVFEAAGWSAVIGAGATYAVEGELRWTLVSRVGDRTMPSRLVPPGEVVDEVRGEGTTVRRVRTYVPEGPIIAGETLNPPGGWSSYPPHRHEHEEVYLYRFDRPDGFGVQVRYDGEDQQAVVVRDGHVERIASGYHPVVAAPHATMYYLWALAGTSETLTPEFDPRYA